jgi:hypothetical protein
MAAFGHHLHQVTETQLEAQIPPDTQDDDLTLEVPTLEQLIRAGFPPSTQQGPRLPWVRLILVLGMVAGVIALVAQ